VPSNPRDSADLCSVADRRTTERHHSVLQLGLVKAGNLAQLALVLNVGCGGLHLRVFGNLPRHNQLRVNLRGGHTFAGRLAWQHGCDVGMQFHAPLSQAELSAVLSQPERNARAPRLTTEIKVLVRSGATRRPGTMLNISPRGAGITMANPDLPQRSIKLGIPGLGTLDAQLRWKNGNLAGVSFNEVVLLRNLARCIQASAID